MGSNSTNEYLELLDDEYLYGYNFSKLMQLLIIIYRSDMQNQYSKPMLWIGMYIMIASLLCILAMTADLLHGLRNRKFWIPCKYSSINAASLLLIAVAMKLPVDLSGDMPGDVDQAAKLGSIAFMCTIMANLLPSLAAMGTNQLLTNITALGIFVITLDANVCIEINTGVVSFNEKSKFWEKLPSQLSQPIGMAFFLRDTIFGKVSASASDKHRNSIIATVYVTILLLLLIIYVCSSLAILKSKQIIESKYQQRHETASEYVKQSSSEELLRVEKLEHHLRNYWIMAGSGSPQFIATCYVTTTAAGVLSVVPAILHTLTMSWSFDAIVKGDYDSDYKWSTLVILIVQTIGVIVGTIAPCCRCFATLSFKVSFKSISNRIKVFKVESYWSAKLSDWKQRRVLFRLRRRTFKVVILYSRNLMLSFCIILQETVVVVFKMIALIPFFFMISVWCFFQCLKWLLKTIFRLTGKKFETLEQNRDLAKYVLQLEDEMELAERTLKGLSKSMNRMIRKGEKKHPNSLMKLILDKSTSGFQEVLKFDDIDHDPSLLSVENQDCWSLPVVTLTTIAVSLPDIEKEHVDNLLKSVREGLEYVTLVEESLNATNDYESIQKAAETLWLEVDVHHKWLTNDLQHHVYDPDQADKTRQIVQWFRDRAKEMLTKMHIRDPNDDSTLMSICANSMYRITEPILLSYQADIDDKVNQKQLHDKLSKMIADIIGACLTNLPQVIVMKCHTSEIEKREASVRAAAQLLGETKQIIKIIQDRQPKEMETNDLPFIGKWRAYLADLRNP